MTSHISGHLRVTNITSGQILATKCEKVTNPIRRGIGLIGRKSLPADGGLIIQPCNSVVSFFMRFAIDVIFVDGAMRVLYVLPNMVPWRVSKLVRGAKFVIELPSGTAAATLTSTGDMLRIDTE